MAELLEGTAAAPGIAIGRAFLLDRRRRKVPRRHLDEHEVAPELARLEAALVASHEQLERVKRKLREREGDDHFHIIEAHQLILRDEHLVDPTRRRIREERCNAEWALRRTVEELKALFDSLGDDYFRERRSDVDFVGDRILGNLAGEQVDVTEAPPPGAVIVAHDLSPADTAQLHRNSVLAFVTDGGGKTSHGAILARAFQIPLVVGVEGASNRIAAGDQVIVDGNAGMVLLRPSADEVEDYRERARRHRVFVTDLSRNRDLPAETTDGGRLRVYANVELPDELGFALEQGAEGVGLYRTEFLFLERTDLPREEEHLMQARGVLRRVAPFPATFRTLDLGADKLPPFANHGAHPEANPALGMRSIRLCLREPSMFKAQLRGLLRASAHGRMRIMFPMISGVDELRAAKAVLDEAREELRREKVPFDEAVPVGIMVEMPSAAMTADLLARECDFMSIGTNDLIQYSLAIDRENEQMSYLYSPLHPAILRSIRAVVEAGHAAGIRVGMCGEMAGDPMYTLILCGLGLDELSLNPTAIPVVKAVLRGASLSESRRFAEEIMGMTTVSEIQKRVAEAMALQLPAELLRAVGSGD
jgi:phosphotransferase system enzyme I (PtsI)